MRNFIVFLGLTSFLYSCESEEQTSAPVKNDNAIVKKDSIEHWTYFGEEISQQRVFKLIDSSLNFGDAEKYNLVSKYHIVNGIGEDFLFAAMTMANKYKNAEAFFDVYVIMTSERYDSHIERMDSTSRSIALYYLLKSYELGYKSSKYVVEKVFTDRGLAIPKSSAFLIFP
jgi:hypothetical protein